MIDDWNRQQRELERQLREITAERNNLRTQLNSEILNVGHRGLVWINAVGAGALVAWLQNVWDKPGMQSMRGWLVAGVAVLLLGVAIASTIFWLRYRQVALVAMGAVPDSRCHRVLRRRHGAGDGWSDPSACLLTRHAAAFMTSCSFLTGRALRSRPSMRARPSQLSSAASTILVHRW